MQFEIHFENAKGHSKAMVNLKKNCFIIFKRYILPFKDFFLLTIFLSESIHGLRTASKNRSKTYGAPWHIDFQEIQIFVIVEKEKFRYQISLCNEQRKSIFLLKSLNTVIKNHIHIRSRSTIREIVETSRVQ